MWSNCKAAMARPMKAIMMPRTPKVMVKVGGSWSFGSIVGKSIDVGVRLRWVVGEGIGAAVLWRWMEVELSMVVVVGG
jgi:hypothetical protein